jgi:hypothetical protein
MIPVNTALKNRHFTYEGRAQLGHTVLFENDRGVIFRNDVSQEPIDDKLTLMRRANCVCSIVAWQHGYPIFAARAGVQQTGSHRDYVMGIRRLVETLKLPAYIVTSKRDAKAMEPDVIRPITLFNEPAVLAEWMPPDTFTALSERGEDLAAELATRYRAVLDPCCGYGGILRPFRYFVGADIDTKCLNYIEREIMR